MACLFFSATFGLLAYIIGLAQGIEQGKRLPRSL
jgi:hypothetical protein